MPYNYNNCSVIHRATWVVFSIEITRASIFFFSRILKFFLIPSLLQFRIPKVLIPFIWRKPVSCRRVTFPVEREKNIDPNLPYDKIIFPRTNDLYHAYKHDNQTRGGFGLVSATGMYLPLGTWFFRNFKQEFLFNGKRVKCLRRNVGPARRLTLPLQKGDWTKWVTLLAEQTFCNLNGSPCFQ